MPRNGTWKRLLLLLIPVLITLLGLVWNASSQRIDTIEKQHEVSIPVIAEHGARLNSVERDMRELKTDVKEIQKDVKELLRRR